MASPPPPYANVTGISRAVMKDSPQETLANYDGNARAGELVVDLDVDPPTLYIGNALGNLNEVTGGGGGGYSNANASRYLANYTGNLSAANITVTGNIIPSANITYNLGNNTNRFNNLYLAGNTIFLGSAILSANASAVTFAIPGGGNVVLQGNANTTLGNIVSVNLDGNSGNILFGNGNFATPPSAAEVDVLNTNGLTTVFYPTFVENRANGQIIRADVDLKYRSDTNTLTVGNIAANNLGNIASINLSGNGSQVLAGNGTWVAQSGGGNASLPLANGNSNINIATANGNVTITSNGTSTWTFDNGGNLTAPGAIDVGNMVIGTVAGDITANNNTTVAFNVTGSDGGFLVNYLKEVGNANTSGGELAFSSETGNATYRISLSDDLGNGFATKIWRFDGNGSLTLPGANVTIGSVLGGDAILSNNAAFGVISQGNTGATVVQWSDDVANTSLISALYINDPVGNTGDIALRTGVVGNPNIWKFTATGNFILPNGYSEIQSIANSSLDPLIPNVSTMVLTPDANYSSQVLVLDPTAPGHIHLRAYASSNIDEPSANIFLGGENTAFEITQGANNVAKIHSGGNTWTFTNVGDLQLASGNSVISSLPNNAGDSSGLSTLNLYPDNTTGDDRYLIIDPTGPSHLHLRAGGAQDASNVLLYLGGEQTYVQIDDGYHRVTIGSYDIGNGVGYNWRFDFNGNLVLPGNTFAVKYANGTQVPLGGLPLANGSSNIDISSANGNVSITANGTNTWTFDTTGNLTLPGNIVGASSNVQIAADGYTWTYNNLGVVSNPIVTYSALPSANTAGYRAFISDGNLVAAGNFGNAVSGGGSNTVPVYSDGTNWCIG